MSLQHPIRIDQAQSRRRGVLVCLSVACCLLAWLTPAANAQLWTHLQSPASGNSYALGTPVRIDWEANYQYSWGGGTTFFEGFGKATTDSGWTWTSATYESGGYGSDIQFYGNITPSATGTLKLVQRTQNGVPSLRKYRFSDS